LDNFTHLVALFLADQLVPLRIEDTTEAYFKNYHFPSVLSLCFQSKISVDMEHYFSSLPFSIPLLIVFYPQG
jgi:hypothetical protein